jgi:hypothetical protein
LKNSSASPTGCKDINFYPNKVFSRNEKSDFLKVLAGRRCWCALGSLLVGRQGGGGQCSGRNAPMATSAQAGETGSVNAELIELVP